MKKKILLLCTFLISFIIYIDGVEAAKQLSCVYQKENLNSGIKFTQNTNGTITFYKYYQSSNWEELKTSDIKIKNNGTSSEYYSNGSYTKCPKTLYVDSFVSPKTIKFNSKNKNSWLKYKEDGKLEIKKTKEEQEVEKKFDGVCNYYNEIGGNIALKIYYNDNEISILDGNGYKITQTLYINRITSDDFITIYNNNKACPKHIYYNNNNTNRTCIAIKKGVCADEKSYVSEELYKGNNSNADTKKNNNSELKTFDSCEELIPVDSELYKKINDIMNIIRLSVPILLLVFGIIDFLKAMFSDEDEMNKAKKKFAKRLVAAVIVFIIPMFVNLTLSLANSVWDEIKPETCIK